MKEPKATKEQFKLTDMCNGNKESNLDSTMDATLNDTMENMEADYSNKASTKENEDNKISPNLYAEEAEQRYIGEFNIPLSAINFASESKAIRKLNAHHLTEFFGSFNSN